MEIKNCGCCKSEAPTGQAVLMGILSDCINVLCPGQIFTDMQAQKVFDSLHHRHVDEDRFVDSQPSSSKVKNQFLGFTAGKKSVLTDSGRCFQAFIFSAELERSPKS